MMELMTVTIKAEGCFGVLMWNQQPPFAVTLEHTFADGLPVLRNGEYTCHRDFYHAGNYETFEIEVAGHDRILFHKGNVEEHSRGCVLVANAFDDVLGSPGISDSKKGFEEFMKLTAGLRTFQLTVVGR